MRRLGEPRYFFAMLRQDMMPDIERLQNDLVF